MVSCAQGTDLRPLDHRPESSSMSIPLWVRERQRPRSRPRAGVLRLSLQSRMPHRTVQVADPSGPVAAETNFDDGCLPRWASDRVRRRRDLNPNLSRDRAVCFRVTPRRHATAIAPGRIELPTSGSKVPRPSPAGTPGLHSAAAICGYSVLVTALWSAHSGHTSAPLSGAN